MSLDLLRQLRDLGVKSASLDGDAVRAVEFFPAEANTPDAPKTKPRDVDLCACGHQEFAHMNGFCSEGCDSEACAPKKPEDAKR